MQGFATIISTIGALLLLGLFMESVAHRLHLPRVTLLLIIGFIIGPAALNLISSEITQNWFHPLTTIALAMIGFLLGSKITTQSFKKLKSLVFSVSISVVIITALLVFFGLALIHTPLEIALILAGLSAATEPAATSDVIFELKSKSVFSQVLLDIVAIDDAWTLIIFSICLILVHFMHGHYTHIGTLILNVLWEIVGAIIIGILLGIPMAYLSGRIKPGKPTLLEALGIVFLGCGIALLINVSYILTMMAAGCTVVNLAKHHIRAFHTIEDIEWPFMVLFFILAGASLNLKMLYLAEYTGIAYIILRIIGRLLGGWFGCTIVHTNLSYRRWMGIALMPQAGLAIGMALVAIQTFPEIMQKVLPIVLASTVIFELAGPIMTRIAIQKVEALENK